eukprot:COSAG02_NODE_877_length_16272_cov_8.002288_12_plen_118_part_00
MKWWLHHLPSMHIFPINIDLFYSTPCCFFLPPFFFFAGFSVVHSPLAFLASLELSTRFFLRPTIAVSAMQQLSDTPHGTTPWALARNSSQQYGMLLARSMVDCQAELTCRYNVVKLL